MKPVSFNYAEVAQMQAEMDKRNAYIEALQSENIALRAERDALLKSVKALSTPIEVIQPRGITE